MKEFLMVLNATNVRYRLVMDYQMNSGKVYRLSDNSLWFEFKNATDGINILGGNNDIR